MTIEKYFMTNLHERKLPTSAGVEPTCLYKSTFLYIVNLGFIGVYIIFLIFAQKHRLWVLVRTASSRRF